MCECVSVHVKVESKIENVTFLLRKAILFRVVSYFNKLFNRRLPFYKKICVYQGQYAACVFAF